MIHGNMNSLTFENSGYFETNCQQVVVWQWLPHLIQAYLQRVYCSTVHPHRSLLL